jgi:YD repeat-containing protein
LAIYDGEEKGENLARQFEWSPASGFIRKDGDWSYKIEPVEGAYAKIERVKPDGTLEFWHENLNRGQRTIVENGVETVSEWFVGGPARGEMRSETYVDLKSGRTERKRYAYNERGQLLRITKPNGEDFFFIYEDGKIVEIRNNGVTIRQYAYDSTTGNMVSINTY